MATIVEIAEGVYRINLVVPDRAVTYSIFLLDDEAPALIETSFARAFDEVREAVQKVLDPRKIRHIVVPHFEADECGGLNQFLAVAPEAVSLCSPIGASSVGDFSQRAPTTVGDGRVLAIGSRRLHFILTPQVHQWDSLMVYEETQGVLYSSDLFIQPGQGKALTDHDLSEQMVESYRRSGSMPSMRHIHAALDKLEPLSIRTIACHHGSVLTGDLRPYFRALRDNDITGMSDYPGYAPQRYSQR